MAKGRVVQEHKLPRHVVVAQFNFRRCVGADLKPIALLFLFLEQYL
jgi:hypothetical protein